MAGKISEVEKNFKIGNKVNSNLVKISSSKSILSYQNGSALNIENCEEAGDEGLPRDGYSDEIAKPHEPFSEDQNLKSKCLDLLRKKLISDLSLTVFSLDLENKLAKMEPIEISKERQSVIQKLLVQISQLSDAEKLLLYLKLPSSTSSPFDPLRQPLNPLGNRQEIQQTIVWIKTHLEEDSEISIPKQDVYDQYLKYCENVSMKPLSTADFGKVMKQVYPGVRPRRLGTRGNSRYCYSGMRNTCKLPTPVLPQSSGENLVSNGNTSDGSSLTLEANKYKKQDRGKRKLKSTTCQSEKCTTLNRPSELEKDSNGMNMKRKKLQEKEEVITSKEMDNVNEKVEKEQGNMEQIKEEVDLGGIKCEESSDNSFNTFEIECELDSEFGIYLKNVEKVAKDSPTRSSLVCHSPSGVENEDKQNELQKILFNTNDSETLNVDQISKSFSEGNLFSQVGNQTEKTNPINNQLPVKANGLDGFKQSGTNQRKTAKGRARRSASFSKPAKNLRKCYVPIQPKPVDMNKFNVRFEQPIVGMSQFPLEQKQESEIGSLCEESDSQEPEEEIIRYFKHLDGNDVKTDNLVNQAVKNSNNPTVQNSSLSQIISKNSVTGYQKNEDVNQQIWRSQSCFEVQRQLFNLGDNVETVHVPRSQSSVELPMSVEHSQQEGTEPESGGSGKTKKISHLRILLEKSISTGVRLPYSGLRENPNSLPSPVISTDVNTVSQPPPPNDPNSSLSPGKLIDRDLLKLNGLKILSSSASYVPNNRTKYFSFTPISPGPQSPLKTPSTPSASPFVSPRSTPGPRSRRNSRNDFFLSPSERKSTVHGKSEFFNENDYNFSKVLTGSFRNKSAAYLESCRPRSFSSTNFCRSKTRRNSSKLIDHGTNVVSPNGVQAAGKNNFLANTQFSIHKNFMSSDCLSNEVRKLLENNLDMGEDRSATIRSQSVPLNRMISESSWVPGQVSSVYPGYFNSGSSNPTLSAVTSEWTSNSDTNSPKDITTNVSPFLSNGEVSNMESGGLNNEVFSEDPTIAQLDQYFAGDFRSANEENFQKGDPFQEESAFSNKLDLNSAETFESPFTSESDPSIAYNIKSYLPDFEGLENKNLDRGEGERKLMKTPLFERGNDNVKDPVITSFKPVIPNEMCSCPGSPVLSFFGNKINEDNQQLIEFFDFED